MDRFAYRTVLTVHERPFLVVAQFAGRLSRRLSARTIVAGDLDAVLRQSAFPAGIDVSEQRRPLRELTSAQPLPADVTVTAAALGGVPTAEITIDGIEPRHVVLYFHSGVYVLGDAFQPPAWPRKSAGGRAPRSSPSTTGSPPSIRTRQW